MKKPDFDNPTGKVPVGISACLMGDNVRYDGGHKRSRYCVDVLGKHFEYRSFCPEVAVGMSVPREPIRLVGDGDDLRAVGVGKASVDVTVALKNYATTAAREVGELSGYIFMEKSPSCGLYGASVYSEQGLSTVKRSGIYAAGIKRALPLLPVEEENRLRDPVARENFVVRVYLYNEWRRSLSERPTPKQLVVFHSRHKYLVMSYGQPLYRYLGQLVADAGREDIYDLAQKYISFLMTETQQPPSRAGHVNVLYHLIGYLRGAVPDEVRRDLAAGIEAYRKERVSLAVPMELVRYYLHHYGSDYVRTQSYLCPHPDDLHLRNAI